MKKIVLMLMLLVPAVTFAQKFGHVDSQAIVQGLSEYQHAMVDLKASGQKYDSQLKEMQDIIQKKTDEYEKAQSTMNPTTKQQTEAEIQQLIQKYQQAGQDNSQAFEKEKQEKLAPILTKVSTAIKNVGKAGGYVYIMDVASGIPYINESISKDVTAEVKAEIAKLK